MPAPGAQVRSPKQLAVVASWRPSAEVRPVRRTGSLLQEWRAQVLRQMELRPVRVCPEAPPPEERGQGHQPLGVFKSALFCVGFFCCFVLFCFRTSFVYELRMSQGAFWSFVTMDRFLLVFFLVSPRAQDLLEFS